MAGDIAGLAAATPLTSGSYTLEPDPAEDGVYTHLRFVGSGYVESNLELLDTHVRERIQQKVTGHRRLGLHRRARGREALGERDRRRVDPQGRVGVLDRVRRERGPPRPPTTTPRRVHMSEKARGTTGLPAPGSTSGELDNGEFRNVHVDQGAQLPTEIDGQPVRRRSGTACSSRTTGRRSSRPPAPTRSPPRARRRVADDARQWSRLPVRAQEGDDVGHAGHGRQVLRVRLGRTSRSTRTTRTASASRPTACSSRRAGCCRRPAGRRRHVPMQVPTKLFGTILDLMHGLTSRRCSRPRRPRTCRRTTSARRSRTSRRRSR
jgi:hypothetical protein